MVSVPAMGFEPMPPKRLDLKSSALDQLRQAGACCCHFFNGEFSMWDLNPRPWAHKTHALPTELNERGQASSTILTLQGM